MSDFLQIEDEIIDGDPQYLVTDNVNGTKSITLANEIIQQGTALNKVELYKLNSVLGYNDTNVSQRTIEEEITYDENSISWDYINMEGTVSSRDKRTYWGNLIIGGTEIIGVDYKLNNSGTNLTLYDGTAVNHTKELFKTAQGGSATGIIPGGVSALNGQAFAYLYFSKPIKIKKFKVNVFSSRAGYVYFTTGKVEFFKNGELVYTLNKSTSNLEEITLDDYIEIDQVLLMVAGNNSSYRTSLTLQLNDFKVLHTTVINDIVSNDYDYNFSNNQIINIQATNDIVTSGVDKNTFNSVNIDTLLEPNKYYELLYDEPNDRFIAEEVRV